MSDEDRPDKKVIITAIGAEAVRGLAVEGVLPYANGLVWQEGARNVNVESTRDYATIEISRTVFERLDQGGAWLPALSAAFRKADGELTASDASRSWWDRRMEGFALMPFPGMGVAGAFALASARADVENHPGVSLTVERYVP